MPKWSRDYLLTALLGAIALMLALAVAVEWSVLANRSGEKLQSAPVKPAPVGEPEAAGVDFKLPPLDRYRQMTERPVFMENRRPGVDVVEVVPPPPPPPTPMNLKLMGIVSTPKEKTALLLDNKGKYKRLKAQDLVDGWVLVELGVDKVTLQQGDRREVLPLLKKKPKVPAPPGGPQMGQLPPPGVPPRPGQKPVPVPTPMLPPGQTAEDMPEDGSDPNAQEEDTDNSDVEADQ
jgi:hypothetical protein